MKTKRILTDEEALAIVEDEDTVWTEVPDRGNREEIRALIRIREQVDAMIDEAVIRARHDGFAWLLIGDALGVTAEAARKKYNNRV